MFYRGNLTINSKRVAPEGIAWPTNSPRAVNIQTWNVRGQLKDLVSSDSVLSKLSGCNNADTYRRCL